MKLSAAASYPTYVLCTDTLPAVWCACHGRGAIAALNMVPVQFCHNEAALVRQESRVDWWVRCC